MYVTYPPMSLKTTTTHLFSSHCSDQLFDNNLNLVSGLPFHGHRNTHTPTGQQGGDGSACGWMTIWKIHVKYYPLPVRPVAWSFGSTRSRTARCVPNRSTIDYIRGVGRDQADHLRPCSGNGWPIKGLYVRLQRPEMGKLIGFLIAHYCAYLSK